MVSLILVRNLDPSVTKSAVFAGSNGSWRSNDLYGPDGRTRLHPSSLLLRPTRLDLLPTAVRADRGSGLELCHHEQLEKRRFHGLSAARVLDQQRD